MRRYILTFVFIFVVGSLIVSCTHKDPPRDEIPLIKKLLGRIDQAVREKNAALLDSLIIADAYKLGYNSTKILDDVYPTDTSQFLKFGGREFFYTKDEGVVNCYIVPDTADTGRPVEMTLVKANDQWYLKRFDLK